MAEGDTIKQKLIELRQQRNKSFLKNLIFLSILATLFAVAFIWLELKDVFIFISISLIPSIVSVVWDKKPGRFSSKIVSAFNLTGMCPYIIAIFSSGSPNSAAMDILYNPQVWFVVFGFAMLGWGVILIIPKITLLFLEVNSKYMVIKIDAFQKQLLEEWGEEVAK